MCVTECLLDPDVICVLIPEDVTQVINIQSECDQGVKEMILIKN